MFVPIPSAAVCDLSSRSSRYIAQTVCRTWQNIDSTTWHSIPATIDLRPDGTGTVASPFKHYVGKEQAEGLAMHEFTWRLGRDGPLGMEDIDEEAMYSTMPKLMQSTHAWTRKPWIADHTIVPAYIRIGLTGGPTFSEGRRVNFTLGDDAPLPIELVELIMEIAAQDEADATSELLYVSRWTRELALSRRRRQRFSSLVQSFGRWGLAFWISCGHFDPPGNPYPRAFFVLQALVFKMPYASGYSDEETRQDWDSRWDKRPLYYSGVLEIPEEPESVLWRAIQGSYDGHPEVKKIYD